MIKQIIVSRSCSHVCPTLPHTPASVPAPTWLLWKRSGKNWGKNWKRCHVHFWIHCDSRPISDSWVYFCPKQQMCNLLMEKEQEVVILTHPRIPDVLLLPVNGPRYARNVWSVWRTYWKTFPSKCPAEPAVGRVPSETSTEYFTVCYRGGKGSVIPAVHTKGD